MQKILFLLCLLLFLKPVATSAQCVTTYPYLEDFETSAGSWTATGANSDWAWGAPLKTVINGAGSGNKCWITGGLTPSAYAGNQKSWIESPCFDFSTLQHPYISFLIFWDTERQYDGGNLQYSLNNGVSWINLGSVGQAVNCLEKNWFNTSSITNLSGLATNKEGWSGTLRNVSSPCLGTGGSGQWLEASLCMASLAGQSTVQFRFTFCSGTTCNDYDGLAIDLIAISEAPAPQPVIAYTCLPGYTISFSGSSTFCPSRWRWDFGNPNLSTDTALGQNLQYTFDGPGSYLITLDAGHPCSVSGTTNVLINFPVVNVDVVPVSCEGQTDGEATALVSGVNNPVITWGTNPISNGATIFNLGAGNIPLIITSSDGCQLDTIVEIPLSPNAAPIIQLDTRYFLCPGDAITLYPGQFTDYLWQDGSTDSLLVIRDAGFYVVSVANAAGCTATDSTEVLYNCGDAIFIPRAFTPGSDGLNDYFQAQSTVLEFSKLWIYNRWGQLVYSGSESSLGWDGTINSEPSPEGVYYYRIRYRIPGDKVREKAGWVTLLR